MHGPLPIAPEAEKLVLGLILLRGSEIFSGVHDIVSVEDFSVEKNRCIFARMKDLFDRGEVIDRITVYNELSRHGEVEKVDGLSYLVSLDDGMPSIPNCESYCKIIKEKAILRRGIYEFNKFISRCSHEENVGQLLEEVDRAVSALSQTVVATSPFKNPYDLVADYPGGMEGFLNSAQPPGSVTLPWLDVLRFVDHFAPGELIVLAGRPGCGKSVAGMQIAHTAAKSGCGVLYVSLEMTWESLLMRLLAGITTVDVQRLQQKNLSDAERSRLRSELNRLQPCPLHINDQGLKTVAAISAAARKIKSTRDVGMIVIDHMQLLRLAGSNKRRYEELSEISHSLKELSKDLHCIVVVLSQLNRMCEVEKRAPVLSDLRDTGSIEEDADIVMLIYRAELQRREDPSLRGLADFIIAKHRNGPIGLVPMLFQKEFQRFVCKTDTEECVI